VENISVMAAPPQDKELLQYWSLLTATQKELLLTIIRSFARADDNADIDQYNEELEQALRRVRSGDFISHEEVKKY
jgi:hypothetical protein